MVSGISGYAAAGSVSYTHLDVYKRQHVWGPAGAIPIVGMEMMRRFTLTFDTKHGLLYLEPNSHFNEPVPAPN